MKDRAAMKEVARLKQLENSDACPDFSRWIQKPNGIIKGRDEALFYQIPG